jgi:serine/threonine protein kinase
MIAGRYKLQTEIKRGAFGAIYKGIYEKTGEQVAIKIDIGQSTLKHEIKMINHLYISGVRKIPSIYWFGEFEAKPSVVMTLYECSLYDYRLKGKPTETKMAKIMWKILEIIESIHKHFVVHRDIKPHNFMIKSGEIYLIDFGLATFYIGEDGEHCPNKSSTTIIGSPIFVSIRIHEGNKYSRRDDLISIGYLYLWMLGSFITLPNNIERLKDTECSPINLDYSVNKYLLEQKENLLITIVKNTNSDIQSYMEYVYGLLYDEIPKYAPMRTVFMYDQAEHKC